MDKEINNWNDTRFRDPIIGEKVLVFCDGKITFGVHQANQLWSIMRENGWAVDDNFYVKYWRHLPDPPKTPDPFDSWIYEQNRQRTDPNTTLRAAWEAGAAWKANNP